METVEISGDLVPVDDGHAQGDEDEGRGKGQEMGREQDPQPADKDVEETVGVEDLQPDVEEGPAKPPTPVREMTGVGLLRLEKPDPRERCDELV